MRAIAVPLVHYVEPDAARGALDGADRCLERLRGEVRSLELGDLLDLCAADLADLTSLRIGGALLDAGRSLEQHRSRRGLGDEGKRPVSVDGDQHRNDDAGLRLRLGVELLAK